MAGPYRYIIGPVLEISDLIGHYYGPPAGCISWVDLRSIPTQSAYGNIGCGFFTMPSGWTVPTGYHQLGGGDGDCRELLLSAIDQSAWQTLIGVRPGRTPTTTLVDALEETLTTLSDPTGADTCKPLVPLTGIAPVTAEIVLAGHSVIRRLPVTGTGVWWNRLQTLHALDLSIISAERPGDDVTWRKVLGSVTAKYFGRWDDIRGNAFIAAALRADRTPSNPGAPANERRWSLPPATTYSEAFPGADSDTFGGELTWTEVVGDWDRVSNQGALITVEDLHCSARADHDVSSSDHEAEHTVVTCDTSGPNHQLGVAARFSASAETFYAFRFVPVLSPDYNSICKLVTGTLTDLGTYDSNGTPPFTQKCQCNGSTIKGFRGGTEFISLTDTAITTGTRGGVFGFRGSTGSSVPAIDDWSITDLAAAGHPAMRRLGMPTYGREGVMVY